MKKKGKAIPLQNLALLFNLQLGIFLDPNRIQMNVPAELHKIFIFFDQDSFVTPLKEVPTPPVAPVEINRVGDIEALPEFPQVGFWGHQKEVKMSLHQNIRMQLNPIKLEVG